MEKTSKLRELSVAELKVHCDELNAVLYELKCENAVQRKLETPHLIKEKRRQKARVLTILREKENDTAK